MSASSSPEGGASEGGALRFRVFSGGAVTIDLGRCDGCPSQACVTVCRSQGGPLVWDEERRAPALGMSMPEIERGGCVECVGCELDCQLHGLGALAIDLPIDGFETYLDGLDQPLVYRR
jgi:NAD-dependent dihydropyrimidine dehydrogenase PreA subunit